MPFSESVKVKALVACGRKCSVCHKFCGNNIEIHHIKAQADGGDDTFENAIPLCFDCHAEVRQYDSKHPKGIKFSEKELIMHRNLWYKYVKTGIDKEENNNEPAKVEPVKIYHQKNYQDILLQRVCNGKDLLFQISGVCAMVHDEQAETLEEAKLLGDFLQYLMEVIDTDDLMEPCDRVMTAFNLNENIKELDRAGFFVFVGKENRKITGGNGLDEVFPALLIRIIRKNSEEIVKA